MFIKPDNSTTICRGKIYEISPTLDYNSGTFEVKILLDNRDHLLKAGMTGVLVTSPRGTAGQEKNSAEKK